MFEAFEATRFVVDQIKGKLIGELRVVCTPALGNAVVPLAISRFREGRPDVKVSVEVGSLDYVQNSVEIGKADVGVHYLQQEHPLLNRMMLGDLSMICIFPEGHPFEEKDVIRPADISGHPFISVSANDPMGAVIENAFKQANVEMHRAIEVRYGYTARDLVALGQGVALVESYLIMTLTRYPELRFRAFRPQIVTSTSAIHLKTRPLSAIARSSWRSFVKPARACRSMKKYESRQSGQISD